MRARIFAEENKKWWTLGAVSFGLFMIMLDNTIVNVALPSIQSDLNIGISELEWVVNGYALTFAVLMLTGGKLADLFGRRFIFIVGLVIFTAASLACGLSPNANVLIAARVVQGVGSAMMNPATLSIITATFPPRQRGMAIGVWAGVSALALAIGPLIGGVITQQVNWNWIFFINVPVGILAIVVARLVIKESRDTSAVQRLDLPGLLTSAIGLFALIYGLIEANTYGWTSARILACFAIAVIGLTAFVLLELHQRVPMLDLSLFRNPTFAGANGIMLLVALAMFGVFFYVSLYVQNILHYSPTQAGATFLPMTLCIVFLAPIAGRISDRYGPRWLISVRDGARRRVARDLRPARPDFELLGHLPGAPDRRGRDGHVDGAYDGDRDARGAGRQGRRRLCRAEQHAPGRRLARDRRHGRDRRLLRP